MSNLKNNIQLRLTVAVCGLLFILSLFLPACDTTEEPPDYTYVIDNVFWSDSLDGNQDGYIQSKRLNINVHLAENVSRIIEAQVFYKRKESSDFSFYGSHPYESDQPSMES